MAKGGRCVGVICAAARLYEWRNYEIPLNGDTLGC